MNPSTLTDVLTVAAELGGADNGIIDVDGSFMSWAEVDRSVRAVAWALADLGVTTGAPVAVLHPKSTASFIAVHGVLRAGGVMVPLDPMGPRVSLEAVLASVAPAVLIGASRTIAQRVSSEITREMTIVASGLDVAGVAASRLLSFEEAVTGPADVDLPDVGADDRAYIIFTSGSTGVPKGIVHTHASALAYAVQAVRCHGLQPGDRLAGTSPLHFDMSTLELYAVPLAGATAVTIGEPEQRFPASLSRRFETERVSHLYAVPYQLRQLQQRGDLGNRDLSALRQVAFGGEAFSPGALVDVDRALPPIEWLNVYGPAEVNAVVTHSLGTRPDDLDSVPIGTPWPGVDVRIVDDSGTDLPPGEDGELLIAAPTCMEGYWQRPDLNDASFDVDASGRRYYRTGDLGRLGEDGLLHFHGRRDNRVKVRGVRIELEEIERVLGDAPGVAHAVAGVSEGEDGMQHVTAWIVAEPDAEVDEASVRQWSTSRLPASAIPSRISALDVVPTTATGKIDRQALRTQGNAADEGRGNR